MSANLGVWNLTHHTGSTGFLSQDCIHQFFQFLQQKGGSR